MTTTTHTQAAHWAHLTDEQAGYVLTRAQGNLTSAQKRGDEAVVAYNQQLMAAVMAALVTTYPRGVNVSKAYDGQYTYTVVAR